MGIFISLVSVFGIVGVFFSGANWANGGGFTHIALAFVCAFSAVLQLALALL